MKFPKTWGGKRKRAGRKPKGERVRTPHEARPMIRRAAPVHVTMRVQKGVYNLRAMRSLRVFEKAIMATAARFGLRVVQFSLQGNHMHVLVEAADKASFIRGMRSLSIGFAKKMNRMMGRKGHVIGDRYHSRVLCTPSETKRVIEYIRTNHFRHTVPGKPVPAGFVDEFSNESWRTAIVLPEPRLWAITQAARKAGSKAPPRPSHRRQLALIFGDAN